MIKRLPLSLNCMIYESKDRTYFGLLLFPSVQFSLVAQSCPTLCDHMNCSTPGLPVHHQFLELTQTNVHRVSDAIQPSHPLSSPSPPAPNPSQHQSLFQWQGDSSLLSHWSSTATSFVKLFKDFHSDGEREILHLISPQKTQQHCPVVVTEVGDWTRKQSSCRCTWSPTRTAGAAGGFRGPHLGAKAPALHVHTFRCVSRNLLLETKPWAQQPDTYQGHKRIVE